MRERRWRAEQKLGISFETSAEPTERLTRGVETGNCEKSSWYLGWSLQSELLQYRAGQQQPRDGLRFGLTAFRLNLQRLDTPSEIWSRE